MTKQSLKILRDLTLTTCFVALFLAAIFYAIDLPRLARGAILSQLEGEVYCVSLGGVTAGACEDAG